MHGERLPLDVHASAQLQRAAAGVLPPALAVALFAVAGALPDYVLEVGFRILLLATMAQAWNLMAGHGGLVSLGTAAFFGIGAYVLVGVLNQMHATPLAAIAAGGLAAAAVACLLSPAVFRLRGLYFTVGTLALSECLRLFMVNDGHFGGATGLFVAVEPPGLRELFQYAIALAAATAFAIELGMRSRMCLLLRAVRDDEDAAAQVGIRPFPVKLAAFALANAFVGMAGGLQALKLGAVEPYGTFGIAWSVAVVSAVLIGGMGTRGGPWIGAVFMVGLGEALAGYPALHLALTGAVLVAVIRFAPGGLHEWACRRLREGASA